MILPILYLALLLSSTCQNIEHSLTEEQDIGAKIKTILDSHLVEGSKWGMNYHFYRPGLQKYGPYQWLWDSAFHMISWSRLNVTNSILDLRTMFQKQNNHTFEVPQMIFWGKQGIKDKILNPLLNSDPTCTDITQMPMLAFSLERIYQQTNNKSLISEFLYKMVEYYQWWAQHRQPDHDGLVVIIHPWESGLDASPMYDEALAVKHPQPKYIQLYPQFQQILLSYRFNYKWDQKKIISPKSFRGRRFPLEYFVVKQVGVNSVYTASWKILGKLARQTNNQPLQNYCIKQYNHFLAGIEKLYDEQKGRYVSKYLSGSVYKTARADTVQSLFPILLPQIKHQRQASILAALKDTKKYNTAYMVPTVSQDDPAFNPIFTIDLMWRGPSWAAPNYFILQGLRRINQTELYKQIAGKWISQVKSKGIYEMWNPLTGQGYGVKELGMSTSVIDVIYKVKNM